MTQWAGTRTRFKS